LSQAVARDEFHGNVRQELPGSQSTQASPAVRGTSTAWARRSTGWNGWTPRPHRSGGWSTMHPWRRASRSTRWTDTSADLTTTAFIGRTSRRERELLFPGVTGDALAIG